MTALAPLRHGGENDIATRVAQLDWEALGAALDEHGYAVLPQLLSSDEGAALAAGYETADRSAFRSRVVMARHGFGLGEYKYFAYPLPELVAGLRGALYPPLAAIANRWNAALGVDLLYPAAHDAYLTLCHKAGQVKPTPLLLRYRVGDYNRLHQDLYGALAFPLQATFLLSDPQRDFSGGEFVLVEQRARMQSQATVVPLGQGDAVIFAVNQRPVKSARGWSRATMRHGVSLLRTGYRMTLGVIFHDAQ